MPSPNQLLTNPLAETGAPPICDGGIQDVYNRLVAQASRGSIPRNYVGGVTPATAGSAFIHDEIAVRVATSPTASKSSPKKSSPKKGNSMRFRVGKLSKSLKEFDVPRPARAPAPLPGLPPASPDRYHNPSGLSWADLVPDVSVFQDFVTREQEPLLRLVTTLEVHLARAFSDRLMTAFPLPVCHPEHPRLVITSSGGVEACSRVHREYTTVTTAPYPEWLRRCDSRVEGLAAAFLRINGLNAEVASL
jgi:hypothetical protein